MYHADDDNEPGSSVTKKAKTEEKEEHKEEEKKEEKETSKIFKGWKISSALNFYCMYYNSTVFATSDTKYKTNLTCWTNSDV